jgi:hypothetical protein
MTNTIPCTGDVVTGDTITFTEGVFGGSHRKPRYLGDREITATVLRESYGNAKQQHTFTLEVIESTGEQAIPAGKQIRRKGRNIYRNGTSRLPWDDENERRAAANEKHQRGDLARNCAEMRREAGF